MTIAHHQPDQVSLPRGTAEWGLLACNKPVGMTSRDVVNHVQRRLQLQWGRTRLKIGHTGTLDPLADGVVVIAIGSATRLTPWLMQSLKRYTGEFELGAWSDSGDLEETVTRSEDLPIPSEPQVRDAAVLLSGWVTQTPPGHSAVWVGGERAYDRVRRGETVDVPSRRVWIDAVEVLRYQPPHVTLDVRCGSGTYLRSLGDDLAIQLGTRAVMTRLTRTAVGVFTVDAAVPPDRYLTPRSGELRELASDPSQSDRWEELCGQSPGGSLADWLVDPIAALDHLPRLWLSASEVDDVLHGRGVVGEPEPPRAPLADSYDGTSEAVSGATARPKAGCQPGDVLAVADTRALAILRRKRGQWWPHRVFSCHQ